MIDSDDCDGCDREISIIESETCLCGEVYCATCMAAHQSAGVCPAKLGFGS